jgi:predicted O-methyltransferase YrrM
MKSKAIRLLSLLPRKPGEFYDRVSEFTGVRLDSLLQNRPKYQTIDFEDAISTIFDGRDAGLNKKLAERALKTFEDRVWQRERELPSNAPFVRLHNGDALLGRLCYAVTRSLRPRAVVETGVCYGVTSAYLLAALQANEEGHLYSVDLPPLGENGDDYVGWLVPPELRDRWTLQRGRSSRLLGPLIAGLGTIDLFVHDSQHTYKNMKEKFDTAWPALRGGGVLISDDVEGNEAFLQLTQSGEPALSLVIREENKEALVGVAVKRK